MFLYDHVYFVQETFVFRDFLYRNWNSVSPVECVHAARDVDALVIFVFQEETMFKEKIVLERIDEKCALAFSEFPVDVLGNLRSKGGISVRLFFFLYRVEESPDAVLFLIPPLAQCCAVMNGCGGDAQLRVVFKSNVRLARLFPFARPSDYLKRKDVQFF